MCFLKGRMQRNRGFTLIEISIVLVVIGLVLGGVLIGRELIEIAKGRQQISQIQEFNAAFITFKGKYNYMPGDMPTAVADSFGLYCDSCGDYDGINDVLNGDGVYKGYHNSAARFAFLVPEQAVVFPQLAGAGLIGGSYSLSGGGVAYPGIDFPASKIDKSIGILPVTPIDWGGVWLAICPTAGGYYFGWLSQACPTTPVRPADAYYLDSKMDDGIPATGTVRAGKLVSVPDDQGIDPDDDPATLCVTDAQGTSYNVQDGQPRCRVFVRIQ
jgi:prepilin-type N-terminal cleavage/methylation domain-containing protein